MANVKRINKTTFRIRISIGKNLLGKYQYKSVNYQPVASTPKAMEKEARQYGEDLEKRIKEGTFLSGEEITLMDFYKVWIKDIAPKHLTQSTLESYEEILKRYFLSSIGNKPLSKINTYQLQNIELELEKELMPQTVKKYFTCISSLMKDARRLKIIKENPVRDVILPMIQRDNNKIQFLDIPQAKAFLKALDSDIVIHQDAQTIIKKNGMKYQLPKHDEIIKISKQFKALFYLAIYGGFRKGEMIALKWNDIDEKTKFINIYKSTVSLNNIGQIDKEPKTKASIRKVEMPLLCFDILNEWKEEQKELCRKHGNKWQGSAINNFDDNYIFIQENGSQMHLSTPTHKFREILEYYNKTVSTNEEKLPIIKFHDLRHTCATILYAQGMDIETISKRLGHSNVAMTLNRYGHALPSQEKRAVTILENMLNIENEISNESIYS